jgi:cephalosporin hydroxylase
MEHIHQNIKGWFDFEDIYKEMVDKHESGSHFVEVGVYLGKSLSYLAVEIINSGKNIKLDAVDTWEGSPLEPFNMEQEEVKNKTLYTDFLKNIEPIKDYINIVKSDSVEASKQYEDNSLDFVYIDASHHYELVKADILAWYPKIKVGGYIGGHDYVPGDTVHGVHKAVSEIFPDDHEPRYSRHNAGSWIHRKK